MSKIAVTTDTPLLVTTAQTLAYRLQLPIIEINSTIYPFLLVVTSQRLELRENNLKKTHPIVVDFLSPHLKYRIQHNNSKHQLLARAIGIKKNSILTVVDATAGLGTDAFILATLGCKVLMLERSSVIHALLNDGLQRLYAQEIEIKEKLDLEFISAHVYFKQQLAEQYKIAKPDVIYLDPMYPERKKSALGKKSLRILHAIVGNDSDSNELLELALQYATKRVVVKRPKFAPVLGNIPPNIQFSARGSTRYDVYFICK